MAAHVIQIFATSNNPHPLAISQDNGATWVNTETDDENFNTTVAVGDTVQFAFSLDKDGVANEISSIVGITPGSFFEPNDKPQSPDWKGTIKSGNSSTPLEYQILYKVTGDNRTQTQDPKLTMTSR